MNTKKVGSFLVFAMLLMIIQMASAVKNDRWKEVQSFVDSTVANDSQIAELCIYAIPTGHTKIIRIAASEADIIGEEGDPEDLEAMKKDKVVTLKDKDDNGNVLIDITYPIDIDGKPVAVAGIMFTALKDKSDMENMAIANAKAKNIFKAFVVKIKGSSKPLW